jgi:SAM-dependent methyltransferase
VRSTVRRGSDHGEEYQEDLAYIHDAGFSRYCLSAAPGVLALLRRVGIRDGLLVDLGSGSGRWAHELARSGYGVLGVEQSAALVRLARRVAPEARFVRASLWEAKLPRCAAVTSFGECLNYGRRRSGRALVRLFRRILNALEPGGVFVFDAAGSERIPADGPRRWWTEGRDWAVLVESAGKSDVLTRRVVCFRRSAHGYRRTEEVHRLVLYEPQEMLDVLARAGFQEEAVRAFGRFKLPEGITGFVARKPAAP